MGPSMEGVVYSPPNPNCTLSLTVTQNIYHRRRGSSRAGGVRNYTVDGVFCCGSIPVRRVSNDTVSRCLCVQLC